jgi:hypothetical protein
VGVRRELLEKLLESKVVEEYDNDFERPGRPRWLEVDGAAREKGDEISGIFLLKVWASWFTKSRSGISSRVISSKSSKLLREAVSSASAMAAKVSLVSLHLSFLSERGEDLEERREIRTEPRRLRTSLAGKVFFEGCMGRFKAKTCLPRRMKVS